MERSGPIGNISKKLAGKLVTLALTIALIIALVIPSVYCYLEVRRLEQQASLYAAQLAVNIKDLVATSPSLWKYQATKYALILDSFTPYKEIVSITIVDEQSNPLSQYGHTNPRNVVLSVLTVSSPPSPITFNNRKIGEITLKLSAASAFTPAIILLCVCLSLGIVLAFLVYKIPLRIVGSLEGQLLFQQKNLEEQVAERTKELELQAADLLEARDKAESANRAKSRFLANMSHEIRTPMNAIIGMTHLAQETKDDGQQQRFLGTVLNSAESLLGILNDILDFSKIEAGQMQFDYKPFKLDRLLETIVSIMNASAVEKGLLLTTVKAPDVPEAFIGDDLRLQQILLNLVSNAIKFTTKGAVSILVQTTVGRLVEGKTFLHFSVKDNGIGISPEKLAEIFESFQQADSSYTRQFGGTGLGLTISRQLTELMGGTMWVESQLGEGSTFHFTIDLAPCVDGELDPDPVAEVETQAAQLARGLAILVVDDNEVNRDVAQMFLEKDHKVVVASDGLEALLALSRQVFDLVLMDVQMPRMDGLTTTSIIRTLEKGLPLQHALPGDLIERLGTRLSGKHMVIIAMTAHAMGGDREMCLAAGMDSYITKPFQPAQLKEMCRGLLAIDPTLGAIRETAEEPVSAVVHDAVADGPISLAKVSSYLQATTRLTPEQTQRVVAAVQRSISENLAKAADALERQDYGLLGHAAHTLKGSLLQCGLNDLADKAEEIHQGVRNNEKLPYGGLLTALQERLVGLRNI